MNRIIKFRAWDGKRMTTSGIMFNTSTGCLEVPTVGSFGGDMTIPYFLMQFTGLKDKNGIDIYEGDIVSFDDYGTKQADVIWLNRASAFVLNTSSYGKAHTKLRGRGKLEVIGNIYQNPELL